MSRRVQKGVVSHIRSQGMQRELDELMRARAKSDIRGSEFDAETRSRMREREQYSEEVRDLSSRLLQAQDEERRRIARELHDGVGQTLALLSMGLAQAIEHAPKTNHDFTKFTNECGHLVDQLSRELRTMSYLLHPPLLDELGLAKAIEWYVKGLEQRSGLKIALEIPAGFRRLCGELELVLFRLVQECLINIHRHSGSTSAVIRMTLEGDQVFLSIRDAGTGISADKLAEIQAQGSGVGIRGMRERVRLFSGQMVIESSHRGTLVFFKFPSVGLAPSI